MGLSSVVNIVFKHRDHLFCGFERSIGFSCCCWDPVVVVGGEEAGEGGGGVELLSSRSK